MLSINNPYFIRIAFIISLYTLEIKETTECNRFALHRDIFLTFDDNEHFNTSLNDKRDDFNFQLMLITTSTFAPA